MEWSINFEKTLLLILIAIFSYAGVATTLKEKIIENISTIFINKKIIKIYIADPSFADIFKKNAKFKKVEAPKNADIILTKDSSKYKNINLSACIISTNYRDYSHFTDIDCGAFFWQKGRPNLILNASIIKERKIKIPKQYNRYTE